MVRVLSGGRLVLNAAGARLLDNLQWVELLWDSEAKKFGIRPAAQGDAAAFRVTYAPSQAVITSKEFIVTHELPYSQRMRLAWDGTMWVASTLNPGEPLS